MEVSTAGLRKPVGELYPAAGFARLCVEAAVPFTLSSDAHLPEQIGYAYDEAVGFMSGLGIDRDLRVHGPASGSWSRSDEPGRHRLRQPPARRPGVRLIIGGVEIEFDRGLDGHSDADVLAHAITDAILGAAGAGDIGAHFPRPTSAGATPTRSSCSPPSSPASTGGSVNVDATVICERPPIGPHRTAIEGRLSEAVGAPVSVKATTNEGLGAIGREEGIAAIAVASFEPSPASATQ